MTKTTDPAGAPRSKPGADGWLEAKRVIADRNDRAQKAGNAERRAREERQQAARRLAEQNGVYR